MSHTEDSLHVSTIRDLIDNLAEECPDRKFLICPDTGDSLTFSELRSLCMSITATLNTHGVRQGDKIAYLSDNGLNSIMCALPDHHLPHCLLPSIGNSRESLICH